MHNSETVTGVTIGRLRSRAGQRLVAEAVARPADGIGAGESAIRAPIDAFVVVLVPAALVTERGPHAVTFVGRVAVDVTFVALVRGVCEKFGRTLVDALAVELDIFASVAVKRRRAVAAADALVVAWGADFLLVGKAVCIALLYADGPCRACRICIARLAIVCTPLTNGVAAAGGYPEASALCALHVARGTRETGPVVACQAHIAACSAVSLLAKAGAGRAVAYARSCAIRITVALQTFADAVVQAICACAAAVAGGADDVLFAKAISGFGITC